MLEKGMVRLSGAMPNPRDGLVGGIAPSKVVRAVGLEPTRGCPRQILSLLRLPFRHARKPAWNATARIAAPGG